MIVVDEVEEKIEEWGSFPGQAEFNLALQGWGQIVEAHGEIGS